MDRAGTDLCIADFDRRIFGRLHDQKQKCFTEWRKNLMVAELISVGTEILLGNITNTNAAICPSSARLWGCPAIIRSLWAIMRRV